MPKTAILDEQDRLVGYEDVDEPGDRVVVPDNCDLPTDGTYKWLPDRNCFWPVRCDMSVETKRPSIDNRDLNKARWFLEDMVKGAYEDWRSDPFSERRARCVAGFANDMAEWAYHRLGLNSNFKSATDFRTHMKNEHREFHILADVANGTKHVELKPPKTKGRTKPKRRNLVTKAEQTRLQHHEGIDSVLDFDSIEDVDSLSEWIVELDDGSQESLSPLLQACIQMWEDFLKAKGA